MAGLKTVFGLIGELIRGLLIITGATALTIAALIYGVAWLWTQADKQPLEWPVPTRDCVTSKAEKVSEGELIARAVAAWEADAAKYAPPYRQQNAGGPIVADKTKLSWIPTVPNDGRVLTAGEYDYDGGLRRDFFLAGKGLKRYAQVSLTLYAGRTPAYLREPSLTIRTYDFDACGLVL